MNYLRKMIYNTIDNINTMSIKQNSSIMNKHEDLSDCSSQSVLTAMDTFLKSVTAMNETVMVPCKLLDLEVTSHKKVPKLLQSSQDPYTFYTLLNDVKNSLIYGPSTDEDELVDDKRIASRNSNCDQWSGTSPVSTTPSTASHAKGHFRRQSTLSMISVNSSDGDSEACSEEGDSGLEVEEGVDSSSSASTVQSTMTDLKNHLIGLHSCLNNLTDTANFITVRYQEEVNK